MCPRPLPNVSFYHPSCRCTAGKNYCVNVPLKDGMDDENYKGVFEPIMSKVCAQLCGRWRAWGS